MAEADTLRLVAEVVDKATPALRNIRTMLQSIGPSGGTRALRDELHGIERGVGRVAGEIRTTLMPALAAVGVTGLGVGGALAGVASALRGFSRDTANLSFLGKEVGVTADKLRQLQALGAHFGVDPSAMIGAVRNFAQQMREIRNGAGDTIGWLLGQGRTPERRQAFVGLAQDLKNSKSNAEALDRALEFMTQIEDPASRMVFSQRVFGDASLGRLGAEGLKKFREALREAGDDLGKLPKSAEDSAVAFERNMARLGDTLRGLRDDIGEKTLPKLTEFLTGIREFVQADRGAIGGTVAGALTSVGDALKNNDWKAIGADLRQFASDARDTTSAIVGFGREVNAAVQGTIGWKTLIEGLIALKIASLTARVVGLAGAVTGLNAAVGASAALRLPPWLLAALGATAAAGAAMKGIAVSRAPSVLPEANAEREALVARRAELQRKLEEFGADGLPGARLREAIAEIDRKLAAVEERMARAAEAGLPAGAAGTAESLRALGRRHLPADQGERRAERERLLDDHELAERLRLIPNKVEKGTEDGARKGVLDGLREFLFGRTAAAADDRFGGAKVQRAALSVPGIGSGEAIAPGLRRSLEGLREPVPDVPRSQGAPPAPAITVPAYEPPRARSDSGVPRIPRPEALLKIPGAREVRQSLRGESEPVPKGERERALRAMRRLTDVHGWTPEAASTAVGQAIKESRVLPNGPAGDQGTAHGMFQWRGQRFANLKRFAQERGAPWTDFDTQVDFFNEERKSRSEAERNWHKETDLGRGNRIGKMFERYAGGLQHDRQLFAERTLRDFERGLGAAPRDAGTAGMKGLWPRGWAGAPERQMPEPGQGAYAGGEDFDRARRFYGGQRAPGDLSYLPDPGADLLRRAIKGGVMGGPQSVEGNASLRIDLNGFPKGTKASTEFGGLFKEVSLNRGRAMTMASEEG